MEKAEVVHISGSLNWQCLRTQSGPWVAVCDPLNLTIQSETFADLMEDVSLTLNDMFRDLGYQYKTTQKRTYLYRRHGTTSYVSVPMADFLTDEFVNSSLRQAGLGEQEARQFIASAKIC